MSRASSPLLAALGCAVWACSPAARPAATARPPEVVRVGPESMGGTVTVRVGQTMNVRVPADVPSWDVQFDPAVLAALTPPERLHAPGAGGWLFKATAPGRSELVLVGAVPCPPGTICPAPPFEMRVTVEVRP